MATKLTAAVRLEGTITAGADPDIGEFGTIKPGVIDKLKKLNETHAIIVVSPVVRYSHQAKLLFSFLRSNDVPFLDIWVGDGIPSTNLWVDDTAVNL